MGWMLVKFLDEPAQGGTRLLWYRGSEHRDAVPDGHLFHQDCVALLEGNPSAWVRVQMVALQSWPANVPSVAELRKIATASVRLELQCPYRGCWTVDAEGHPCEVAHALVDGATAVLVNYAGWRTSDFGRCPVDVRKGTYDGKPVLVLPARSLPGHLPGSDSFLATPPLRSSPVNEASSKDFLRDPQTDWKPSVPRRPQPRLVEHEVALRHVEFRDREVSVRLPGPRIVTVPLSVSRAEFEAIKRELGKHLPRRIKVVETWGVAGEYTVRADGLEELQRIFEEVSRRSYVRKVARSRTWVDAIQFLQNLPGGGAADDDPEALLSFPELGLGARREAFRRLFLLRSKSSRIQVLPNRALLVPVDAVDGGPCWWTWERVDVGNATYLFRPASAAELDETLAWLVREMRREALLTDSDLQRRASFICRVYHLDGDEELDRWWHALLGRLGRRSSPP